MMVHSLFRSTLTLILLAGSALTAIAQPLVDVAWVKTNLGRPGIVLLDVRSGAGVTKEAYLKGHIPGAVFTDYAKDGWREKNAAGVEGMLPEPVSKLESLIGRLGIGNGSHVVLVPEGRSAADMGAATRLYWTFKVVGHDKVSILNGGYAAWTKDIDGNTKQPVNAVESGDKVPNPEIFRATLRREMLIDKAGVQAAQAAGKTLVDYRPHDFFVGLSTSPAAKKPGTIPGAKNVPESWLTVNNSGTFRSKAQLEKVFSAANVPTTGPQVTFCNTGHWASLGWFVVAELLGNKDVTLYDGSMADWTADPNLPVEQKIKLE